MVVASLLTGVADLDLDGRFSGEAVELLLVSRLPRTLAALLSGASLAVAGTIMQMLARNRFVEPTTAGTAECAALGLLLVTLLLPSSSLFIKMIVASASALAGTALFVTLIRRLPPTQPLMIPLTGIVFGSVVGSVVMFIAYETDLLQYAGVWMTGEFSGVVKGRYELLWGSGAALVIAYVFADRFTIAGMGKDVSVSLGLNYRQVLWIGLLIVSQITAFTVITVGMLPFVGLVVPNIVRRTMGDNTRQVLPLVALTGGALVLASDVIGRLIRYPYEIPAATIFGVAGTAIFLWLLFSRQAQRG
ncbi:iron chelate uptake ABC transporter family permease subunit [Labrenzia aggregata]|uniref:Iron chelate uptake ABC transporter family permease subunit n=1 Tax=Roseibium aggregatum TaxID=187304 RepID=A0A939J471_9HYPH|nr:iron chelate uptake ABC transporter family permease subunit [Roseibium aggregatum]